MISDGAANSANYRQLPGKDSGKGYFLPAGDMVDLMRNTLLLEEDSNLQFMYRSYLAERLEDNQPRIALIFKAVFSCG